MKHLCIIFLLFILLAFPTDVRADVAPPINPSGSNPQPGADVTQVRMQAETVLIEVQQDKTSQSLGMARVTADFNMHNLGSEDESMAVRFPISDNNGRGEYPEIANLTITVDGERVKHRRVDYPGIQYWNSENIPWAEFDVTFPPGEDVPIRVTYDLDGSGYYPYTAFYYVLETGAGWKGTIGSADVILRLPYEASPQNVIMGVQIGWAETTPGGFFQGNEVHWHFENFEPGQNQPVQNMELALVAPSAWQTVLSARAEVTKHPNDGEAWGILAKNYKQVFQMSKGYREDAGGEELYQASVEAYEKCLSLKPNDAEWHAGFADLLATRSMWDMWAKGTTPETIRALDEIHTALELAPNDPVVQEIAQNITYLIHEGITQNGDQFEFPWLTQTPTTFPPTLEIVLVEEVTATSVPAATGTAQANPTRVTTAPSNATPVPQTSSPCSGSVALVPLAFVIWIVRKRG